MTGCAHAATVKTVAIVNAVILNGGDAAILLGSIALLQKAFPSLERVAIFSSSASAVRRYYPDLEVYEQPLDPSGQPLDQGLISKARYSLNRMCTQIGANNIVAGRKWLGRLIVDAPTQQFLRMLPEFDLLCTAGGTYITEFYNWRGRITVLEMAKAHRLPVVFLTQSLLVKGGEKRIEILRRSLPTFDLFLVRDAPSASFLTALGVARDRIHQVADAAFALAEPEAWREQRTAVGPMRVAVSVREWPYFISREPLLAMESYLDSVAAAVDWLVSEKGAQITFLSTCQGIEEYRFDDSAAAEKVVGRLSLQVRRSVSVETSFRNPVELSRTYKTYDVVIATRMHAAILALNAGVPVLPIAYEFKTHELWNSFGLAEYIADIEEIEPEMFLAMTKRFISQLPAIRQALLQGVLAARASAISSSELIREAHQAASS